MKYSLSAIARAALNTARKKLNGAEKSPLKVWTHAEVELLRELYPDLPNSFIAERLGRELSQIQSKAHRLKLQKSHSFREALAAELSQSGTASRFQAGHQPWNTGMTGLPALGRSSETQFKKGRRPHTWLPVGSERVSQDGYLQRKVSDTGYPPRDWKGVHILLWEEHHGQIPAGHCVCFKDGQKTNVILENLELLSRAERMSRNTIHRYPTELKSAIRTVRKLERVIREVEREKQN